MQVDKHYTEGGFNPFDLTLKVRSREEAQALYAMFNYVKSNCVLDNDTVMAIKNAIGEEFYIGCSNSHTVIGNGVTYGEYYK
jgi:hypothetical protein